MFFNISKEKVINVDRVYNFINTDFIFYFLNKFDIFKIETYLDYLFSF